MKILKRIAILLGSSLFTYVFGFLIGPIMFAHGSSAAFDFGVFCYATIFFCWLYVAATWGNS